MTRNKRRIFVGFCLVPIWIHFAHAIWIMHSVHEFDQGSGVSTRHIGSIRWLTLESKSVFGGGPSSPEWRIHPSGVGLLLLVSAALGVPGWLFWRWLVRNSALRGLCDGCGYILQGGPEDEQCPECGRITTAAERRREISRWSFRFLCVVLILAGIGAGVNTTTSVARMASSWHSGMNLVNPGPMSSEWFDLVGLSAFLVFIFSMVLFAIWLYLEPTKHPQHRRRRNQLGGGV